jgi:histidinol-phosphate aminotransferase
MNSFPKVREAVRTMAPYHPPSSGRAGKERLDFNENTVGAPAAVAEFLREAITAPDLSVYPEYTQTKPILARHFQVEPDQFLLTNGTDEAIQVLVNTFVDAGDEVLILTPSYAMYRFYSEVAGAAIRMVPYREGTLQFPLNELLSAITPATKAVFLSNPNNPTGTAVSVHGIEQILKKASGAAVLVDEAYYEFHGVTVLPLIERYANLLVSRTFSKVYGLAALRIGCLFSNEANVEMMHRAQSPYSVNRIAAMAAAKAVEDPAFVRRYVTEVLAARELTYVRLEQLGIPYFVSEGNFVLVNFGARATEVRDRLKAQGILVRDRSYEIAGCVRITVGTRDQMETLFEALTEIWRS